MQDVERFLRHLFVEGDVIELRAKSESDKGLGWRGWITLDDLESLRETIIPINELHERNIWAGVCPRVAVESGVPKLARVVWADVDGVSPSVVGQSLEAVPVPRPTMVVDSGHGTHLYWRLSESCEVDRVRAVTRWLSTNIPGADGATHDPTRVLRLAGTTNFKAPRAETRIVLLEDRTVQLSDFPTIETRVEPTGEITGAVTMRMPIDPDKEADLWDIWQNGQRHAAALAISGYLRKNLKWSEEDAVGFMREIHFAKGGVPGDENDLDLRNCAATTYRKPMPLVRGYEGLRELGIEWKDEMGILNPFPPRVLVKPPRMKLINFASDLKPQEFWVDGFVGPGLLTLIAAQPKVGKSMFAMQLGHALSNGYNVFDFATDGRPHSVLYFQGELSQGMVYSRAKDMFAAGTFEDARKFGMTDKPDKVLNLVSDPEPLMDLAEHYEVVIIDPLSIFNANDENSVTSVRETLAVFDALKAEGKAVVLIHHTRKLQTNKDGQSAPPSVNDIRGNGAWFAAVDAVGMLYSKGDSGNAEMKFTFRAAPERPPLSLYRMPHGGFTSSRDVYLRQLGQRGVAVDLGSEMVN